MYFPINTGDFALQTMAATKRNAGLTSALPRATLNDEELVSVAMPPAPTTLYGFIKLCVI